MAWLIVAALGAEVGILCVLDRKLFRAWLTPTTVLAVPYLIIVVWALLAARRFGFVPLYAESIVIWMAGLLAFWGGGAATALVLGRDPGGSAPAPARFETESRPVVLVLAWIAIPIIAFQLVSLLRAVGGFGALTSEYWRQTYLYGPVGHVMDFAKLLLVFLIGTVTRKDKVGWVTIVVLVLLTLLGQVKGAVMVPIIGGVSYRVMTGRFRVTVGKLVAMSLLIYVLFNLVYLVGAAGFSTSLVLDVGIYKELRGHMLEYLFSGVLASGEAVRLHLSVRDGDWALIYAPLVNLTAALQGKPIVSAVTDYFSVIGPGLADSNVHTFFGALQLFLGTPTYLLHSAALGFAFTLLYVGARRSRHAWFLAVLCFELGPLGLGWFDYYLRYLVYWEVPVYALAMSVVAFLRAGAAPRGVSQAALPVGT